MASIPYNLAINATESRPSPRKLSTLKVLISKQHCPNIPITEFGCNASSGLSPLSPATPLTQQIEDSEFVDSYFAAHTSSHSTSRRRRGQVSEREIETYQQWKVEIKL